MKARALRAVLTLKWLCPWLLLCLSWPATALLGGPMRGTLRSRLVGARCGISESASYQPLPVTCEGSGDAVLFFIHGWPDNEETWRGQMRHFSDRFRCVRATMPHFAGRSTAKELGHRASGYDFTEVADILAATICNTCPNCRVVLVTHDWGAVWGFFVQLRHPNLVKAIVAMDVGTPASFPAGLQSLRFLLLTGFTYQYPLLLAFMLSRLVAGTPLEIVGQRLADGIVHKVQSLVIAKEYLYEVTADSCYPYYYFQTNCGIRGVDHLKLENEPSVPCLYFYGKRKPYMFHKEKWLAALQRRSDCRVVAMDTGHWVHREKTEEVNQIMDEWLRRTLEKLDTAGSIPSSTQSK